MFGEVIGHAFIVGVSADVAFVFHSVEGLAENLGADGRQVSA